MTDVRRWVARWGIILLVLAVGAVAGLLTWRAVTSGDAFVAWLSGLWTCCAANILVLGVYHLVDGGNS